MPIPVVGTMDVIRKVEDLGSSFTVQVGKYEAKYTVYYKMLKR